jgi:hypothetical protein
MRLNGWQRIGIVASTIWAIDAPIYLDHVAEQKATDRWFASYDLCWDNPRNDPNACLEQASRQYDIVQRYRLFPDTANVAFVSLVPIVLGWLLAYALVGLGRWIRAGFGH